MHTTALKVAFAAAAVGALAEASVKKLGSNASLFRRQAFDPEESIASGETCVDAFGPGYVQCAPATVSDPPLCINPNEGQTCCENLWGCPAGSFCLVQNLCCPDGLDPDTCAVENSVSIPSDFTPSTASALPETTAVPDEEEEPTTDATTTPVTTPVTTPAATNSGGLTTTPAVPTTTGPVLVSGAAQERIGGAGGAFAALVGFAVLLF